MARFYAITEFTMRNRALKFGQEYISEMGREVHGVNHPNLDHEVIVELLD